MTNSLKDIIELNVSLVVITDLIDANVKKYADKIIKCYPRDRNIVNNAIDKSHIKKIDGVMTLGYENMPVIASIAERFNIN
jgi:hypothetical protein